MFFKNKIVTLSFLLNGWIGVTIYSCSNKKAEIKPACSTPETVSFGRDIIPMFNENCSISACHTGANATGNLDLDASVAYSQLMKSGTGYIDTIHPAYSLLYAQMMSTSKPMPPSGQLGMCTTSLVLKWIQQKAKNN